MTNVILTDLLINLPVWAIVGVLARVLYTRINTAMTELAKSIDVVSSTVTSFAVSIAEIKKDINYIDKSREQVEEMIVQSRNNKTSLDALHSKVRSLEAKCEEMGELKAKMYEEAKLIKHRQHWFNNKITILKLRLELDSGKPLGDAEAWKLPSREDM